MADDLFSWAERPPAPSAPERSYGSDDKSHREKVLDLLRGGEWHSSRALMQVGGTRYGSRVQELRDAGYLIECEPSEDTPGVYHWRLTGQGEPPKRRSWKTRALEAEARVLELEAQHGGK